MNKQAFLPSYVKSLDHWQLDFVPPLGAPGLDFETWESTNSMKLLHLVKDLACSRI
jgi:hypothetical protein